MLEGTFGKQIESVRLYFSCRRNQLAVRADGQHLRRGRVAEYAKHSVPSVETGGAGGRRVC